MDELEKQLRQALEPAIKDQVGKLRAMAIKWASERHIPADNVALAIVPEIRVKAHLMQKPEKCVSQSPAQNN